MYIYLKIFIVKKFVVSNIHRDFTSGSTFYKSMIKDENKNNNLCYKTKTYIKLKRVIYLHQQLLSQLKKLLFSFHHISRNSWP